MAEATLPPPGTEMDARRPLWQRIARWGGLTLLGLALVLGALVIGLNTAPGKRLVAERIAGFAFQNGMGVRVGRIEGSLYGAMVLRNVALTDVRGTFATAPEIRVDWRPFAFIGSHLDIRSVRARLATLQRLPVLKEVPPNNDPWLPDYDIDIGAVRIDRFVAEPAVSGVRRVGRITGKAHIADRRAQVRLDAALSGGDRALALIDAVPDDGKLRLDIDLSAPRGGVLAAMAGLSQPLTARLKGAGDWASWSGRIAADLGGEELARFGLTGRSGTFRLTGETRAGALIEAEGQGAALLGPVTTLDLTAALDERRARIIGSVASAAFRLDANGIADLGESRFEDLQLAFVLLRPAALAEGVSGTGVRARATLDGGFATPTIAYSLNADRIAFNDIGIERLTASGEANVTANRTLIPVIARAGRITGLDTVAGGTLRNVTLAGDLAIDAPRVLSDNIRLRSDRIDAGVILLADLSTGLYAGAINGRIDDYRVASVGRFDLETDVDLKTQGTSGFALTGRVRARSTRLINDGVRDFLGGNFTAGANVRYGTDGVARFSGLQLRAPDARIDGGQGFYDAATGRIGIAAQGRSDAYGPLGVRVAGTIANPDARITAARPGLGIGLAGLEARITGAGRGAYRLAASGQSDYGPLSADLMLRTGRRLTLDIARADLGGVGFAGQLVQTPAGPFAGRLDASGQGVAGVVRLDAAGSAQRALINLRAANTTLPGPTNLAIRSAIVDAEVILADTPTVLASFEVAGTQIGALSLAALRAKVDYRDRRGRAQVLAEGVSGVPFRVAANADLAPDLWRVAARGKVRGIAFETKGPARIVPGARAYDLLPTRIDFGRGSVRLAGSYGAGLAIQSRLDALDMALVDAFVPGLGVNGRASGSLDFAQANSAAFPRADARLQIAGFSRTTAVSVSQPVDINFVGKLLPTGGEARAVMRRRGTVIGRMNASLMPLGPGAGPWTQRLLAAPLGGGIRYNGPADTLFSFAGQPDQRLSGPIAVGADFSGRVSAPQLAGIVRSDNLVYENQTYGTRLSGMAIAGRFRRDRFEIERLTATAGEGTVSAQGFVSLAETGGYPMDITATLRNARVARSDALAASATGEFRLTKAAGEDALLAGRVTLPEARYQLIRQGGAEVPELTGVRFKPPRGPVRITGDEPAATPAALLGNLRLDIAMTAPEQLYVSGMGLESEWRADLRLRGTAAAPRMAGEVELVRGTLGFGGRSFTLSDGRVGFTGGRELDPVVAMTATEEIDGVTVNVNVSGRAYNPQIAFTSSPGLPRDEILSRILFGSSVGNLSAIQAVQLAASLNSLRGSGGGLNPLGKLRAAAGIDRLRILGPDDASGRGTALAAGQYLSDDIYIEFITDARGFTATQLEVSLTPFLSILSQAGGSGATNVDIRYRKDY